MEDSSYKSTLLRLVNFFYAENIQFAICGGLAAGLYRKDLRTTADIDVIVEKAPQNKYDAAFKLLKLVKSEIREAELNGGPLFVIKERSSPVQILAGRNPKNKESVGVDLLLTTLQWTGTALERARKNIVQYGDIEAPTITVEDLIVAKLYAMKIKTPRFKDLDDLEQIFLAEIKIDFTYLRMQLDNFKLKIPKSLAHCVPKELKSLLAKRRRHA